MIWDVRIGKALSQEFTDCGYKLANDRARLAIDGRTGI